MRPAVDARTFLTGRSMQGVSEKQPRRKTCNRGYERPTSVDIVGVSHHHLCSYFLNPRSRFSITFERRADVKDDVSGKDARTISQRSNR
jgi:hypothetical protein